MKDASRRPPEGGERTLAHRGRREETEKRPSDTSSA